MAGPYETWARKTGRLHPDAQRVLQPFFAPLQYDLNTVRLRVMSERWGTFGGRERACIVLGPLMTVIPGALDVDGVMRGRLWSWRQPMGIALWGHEVFHTYQWYRGPRRYLVELGIGLVRSWCRGNLYLHEVIATEQEAIAFEHDVAHQLTTRTTEEPQP